MHSGLQKRPSGGVTSGLAFDSVRTCVAEGSVAILAARVLLATLSDSHVTAHTPDIGLRFLDSAIPQLLHEVLDLWDELNRDIEVDRQRSKAAFGYARKNRGEVQSPCELLLMSPPDSQGAIVLLFVTLDADHVHSCTRCTLDIAARPEPDHKDGIQGGRKGLAEVVSQVGWLLVRVDYLVVAVLVMGAKGGADDDIVASQRVRLHLEGHAGKTASPRDHNPLKRENELRQSLHVLVGLVPAYNRRLLIAVLDEVRDGWTDEHVPTINRDEETIVRSDRVDLPQDDLELGISPRRIPPFLLEAVWLVDDDTPYRQEISMSKNQGLEGSSARPILLGFKQRAIASPSACSNVTEVWFESFRSSEVTFALA